MMTLLQTFDGVVKTVTLMLIHLCCPELREESQVFSKIPLASFTSLSLINQYIESIIKYGVSTEIKGRIFILGNSGTRKSSLAGTLKNNNMKSYLTGNPENKEKENTRLLDIIPELKLKTKIHNFTKKYDGGCITMIPK